MLLEQLQKYNCIGRELYAMKYYCIKQPDMTDCGAACLCTISKQYGLNLAISKIREIAGTDKRETNVYGIVKAAEQLGFTAKGVKGDENEEVIVLLYIFKAILESFRNHLMLFLEQKLDIPLILGYYNHVLGFPMNFFETRKVGDIVSR